jgi:hypothetical protein
VDRVDAWVGDVRDATSLGLAHVDLMMLAAEGPPFIGHVDLGTKFTQR